MNYHTVKYKGKHYAVVKIKYKDNIVPYIIDNKYLNTILSLNKNWNYRKNGGK